MLPRMKAYVLFTGILFGLVVVAHVWRMCVETHLVHDPTYWVITGLAAAMSTWAWISLARSSRV